MYKTVRHGENSLQYTILPQTEEVLSNSGLKGKGRDYSPSIHVRRSRRKSDLKYALWIISSMAATLVLTLVPLYIIDARNQQGQHEIITPAPMASAARDMVKSRKKELKMSPEIVLTLGEKSETSTTSTSPTTTPSTAATTVTSEKGTTPPWTMPALRSWKSSTSSTVIPPIPTEDNVIPLIGTASSNSHEPTHDTSVKWEKDIIIRATVTPEPITLRSVLRYYSRTQVPSEKSVFATKGFDDVLITTKATTTRTPVTTEFTTTSENSKLRDLKDTMLSVDDDDEFKESLEVDEVFSLPPLKPDYAAPGTDSDEVTVSKAGDAGWYGARWPFVDTSSYFQWTGYSPGDNLLLPLLVAALSSIALVLLLALAVRRRKRSQIASSKLGKLTADLQADDNTNLLTAENAEDGDGDE
ncbi:mucin-17 isoform X1 [Helicoverpa zea]|uniref:mucin-17 isoform X1 n=1 Tax=Helicoverpa zea TaxID=7113 RepID=UPI001F5A7F70|nr:mucin-17 isoform X1 [Helicoverpa zea]